MRVAKGFGTRLQKEEKVTIKLVDYRLIDSFALKLARQGCNAIRDKKLRELGHKLKSALQSEYLCKQNVTRMNELREQDMTGMCK